MRMTVAPPLGVALDGILDEIEARVFSRREREPSFYQGLFRPSLHSVLRGGIAYPWDLGLDCFPARNAMDTHPRTLLVSRYCASDDTPLGDRRFHT
jgi:hypothetical protein